MCECCECERHDCVRHVCEGAVSVRGTIVGGM
jgi:hypothetical protein